MDDFFKNNPKNIKKLSKGEKIEFKYTNKKRKSRKI